MFLSANGVPPTGTTRIRTICAEKHAKLRAALLANIEKCGLVTKIGVISIADPAALLSAVRAAGRVVVDGRASLRELVENHRQLRAHDAHLVGRGLNDVILTPEAAFFDVNEDTFRRMGIDTMAKDDVKGAYRRRVRLEWSAKKLVERFLRLMDPAWFPTQWRGHAREPLTMLPCTVPLPAHVTACGLPPERDELLDWVGQVYLGMAEGGDARAWACPGPFGIHEVQSILGHLEQHQTWFVLSVWTETAHFHGVVKDRQWECLLDG